MIEGDLQSLDELVCDDLIYQHGTGARQGKTEYLGLIGQGGYRYTNITDSNEEVYLYEQVAVIVTSLHFELTGIDGPFSAHRRATLIWVRDGERWRLQVYQGTILPDDERRAQEALHEPESVRRKMQGSAN